MGLCRGGLWEGRGGEQPWESHGAARGQGGCSGCGDPPAAHGACGAWGETVSAPTGVVLASFRYPAWAAVVLWCVPIGKGNQKTSWVWGTLLQCAFPKGFLALGFWTQRPYIRRCGDAKDGLSSGQAAPVVTALPTEDIALLAAPSPPV